MPLCLGVCVHLRLCDNSRSKQVYGSQTGVQSCVLSMHDSVHVQIVKTNFWKLGTVLTTSMVCLMALDRKVCVSVCVFWFCCLPVVYSNLSPQCSFQCCLPLTLIHSTLHSNTKRTIPASTQTHIRHNWTSCAPVSPAALHRTCWKAFHNFRPKLSSPVSHLSVDLICALIKFSRNQSELRFWWSQFSTAGIKEHQQGQGRE